MRRPTWKRNRGRLIRLGETSFNGDLGRVVRIDREEGALVASFDGGEVTYSFGELDAVLPAYAKIHKSQRSEYPAVVVTLATQYHTMLARNLVYTAVTRGKRLVVIVGQKRALAIAIRNARTNRLDEAEGVASAVAGKAVIV